MKGKVSNVDEKLRPVWLLDVDGVINVPWRHPQGGPWEREDWRRLRVANTDILVSQPVLDFITRMHEEGLVEVRWHTAWQEHALELGEALGLPVFPVQPSPEWADRTTSVRPREGQVWFKLPAAQRVVEQEERALVWTDDDLAYRPTETTRALRAMRKLRPVLTVAPSDRTALTPKHLRQIEAFLRAQSDAGHTEELTTPLQRSTV